MMRFGDLTSHFSLTCFRHLRRSCPGSIVRLEPSIRPVENVSKLPKHRAELIAPATWSRDAPQALSTNTKQSRYSPVPLPPSLPFLLLVPCSLHSVEVSTSTPTMFEHRYDTLLHRWPFLYSWQTTDEDKQAVSDRSLRSLVRYTSAKTRTID